MSSQEKVERMLATIDQLGAVKIKHLQKIHDLKSYNNACKYLRHITPYTHSTFYNREKIYYLNKQGRDLIGSKKEIKMSSVMQHTLLRNDVYIYYNCPIDWQCEVPLNYEVEKPNNNLGIVIKGMNVVTTKQTVADAVFTRNGYTHVVEVDNKRHMLDNRKKIETYVEVFKKLNVPKLCVFTTTADRKKKFEKWLLEFKLRGEVKTYEEIK